MTAAETKALRMIRAGASYDLTERVTGIGVERIVELLYGRDSDAGYVENESAR